MLSGPDGPCDPGTPCAPPPARPDSDDRMDSLGAQLSSSVGNRPSRLGSGAAGDRGALRATQAEGGVATRRPRARSGPGWARPPWGRIARARAAGTARASARGARNRPRPPARARGPPSSTDPAAGACDRRLTPGDDTVGCPSPPGQPRLAVSMPAIRLSQASSAVIWPVRHFWTSMLSWSVQGKCQGS